MRLNVNRVLGSFNEFPSCGLSFSFFFFLENEIPVNFNYKVIGFVPFFSSASYLVILGINLLPFTRISTFNSYKKFLIKLLTRSGGNIIFSPNLGS